MRGPNSRHMEFGNSIISRYCGSGTYYDPITLLFPRMHTEAGKPESLPRYTNIYQLWYLKEENHIYEKKLTFLTNLLEKNIHIHAAFQAPQQAGRTIHGRLPQLEGSVRKQITDGMVGVSHDGKNEGRREEVPPRRLEGKYGIGREAAEKLYLNLIGKIHPQLKEYDYHRENQDRYREETSLPAKEYKNPIRNVNLWGHYGKGQWNTARPGVFDTDVAKDIRYGTTDILKGNINWNKKPMQNINRMHWNPLYQNGTGLQNHSRMDITELKVIEDRSSIGKWIVSPTGINGGNVTGDRNYRLNINQTQWMKMKNPLEFYSHWMDLYQTVNRNRDSWYKREGLYYPTYLSQVNHVAKGHILTKGHAGQTEVTAGDAIGSRNYRPNMNQIQQGKLGTPLEFYSHWISRYQTVNRNRNSWHKNGSVSYPSYLSQINNVIESYIGQSEETGINVTGHRGDRPNIYQTQPEKIENSWKVYNHWMNQYQTMNRNGDRWYRNGRSADPLYLSGVNNITRNYNRTEGYMDRTEITGGDIAGNEGHRASINQIQQKKLGNPLAFYSYWMKQYRTVNKNENGWYRNENSPYPAYLAEVNNVTKGYVITGNLMSWTEVTGGDITGNKGDRLSINQIQQKKLENPLAFYSHWMNQYQTVHKNEDSWYRNGNSSYPVYLAKINNVTKGHIITGNHIGQAEVTGGDPTGNKGGRPSINQIQQKKLETPLAFYSYWMKQHQTVNKNEDHAYPACPSEINHVTKGYIITWNHIGQAEVTGKLPHRQVPKGSWNHIGQAEVTGKLPHRQVRKGSWNHIGQTEVTGWDSTGNKGGRPGINQIRQKKLENPLAFYSHWMDQYQTVNKNGNRRYRNGNLSYPAYLAEINHVTKGHSITWNHIGQTEVTGWDSTGDKGGRPSINQIQQKKLENPLAFYSHWMNPYQTVNRNGNRWYRNENLSYPAYLAGINHVTKGHSITWNHIAQTEVTGWDSTGNKGDRPGINQIQQKKLENPLEFYSHWMNPYQTVAKNGNRWYKNGSPPDPAYLPEVNHVTKGHITRKGYMGQEGFTQSPDREYPYTQLGKAGISLNQVMGSSELSLIYGGDGKDREAANKEYRQVVDSQEQMKKEIAVIKETHNEISQWNQTYQLWEKKREKAEAGTVRLNSEQGKRYVQQEAEKIFERQMDGNISQIAGQVYRKLEQRLKTERDRRGIR